MFGMDAADILLVFKQQSEDAKFNVVGAHFLTWR
jgi:hypothetical protein